MKLTLYSEYSLRVLLYLNHKHGEPSSLTEIAEFYGISRNHLMKVVSNLRNKNLVLTERGRNGGIWLARPAADIKVGDVVRLTEPDLDFLDCFKESKKSFVLARTCTIKQVLQEATSIFVDALNKYSLSDIAELQVAARHSIPINKKASHR